MQSLNFLCPLDAVWNMGVLFLEYNIDHVLCTLNREQNGTFAGLE
jgi:hypothetical protein